MKQVLALGASLALTGCTMSVSLDYNIKEPEEQLVPVTKEVAKLPEIEFREIIKLCGYREAISLGRIKPLTRPREFDEASFAQYAADLEDKQVEYDKAINNLNEAFEECLSNM